MRGGSVVPWHRHTDREATLVLEGAVIRDGRVVMPGESLEMAAKSEHEFGVGEGGAVFGVLHARIEFLG